MVAVMIVLGTATAAAPAAATMGRDEIGCSAGASVQGRKGKSVEVDVQDAEVRFPRQGAADWRAATAAPVQDESGAIRLRLGLWDVVVERWGPSANASGSVGQQGSTPLPVLLRYVPPGRYRVGGAHVSSGGRCAGAMTVLVAGSTLTTLLMLGAAAVSAGCAAATVSSGRRRPGRTRGRPVKGAVMGAGFGVTLVGVLLSCYLIASDSLLLVGLPGVTMLTGLALGVMAPFARGEAAG